MTETSGSIASSRFVLSGDDDGASANISELRTGFKQGFIFEILDTSTGRTVENGVHVLVLNPVRYTLSEPFQVTLTPAEDNSVVREENGIIVREITLEGTPGVAEKRARGYQGAQGGGNPLSGADHFQALRNFFRLYSSLKKDATRAASIQMIFHALRDGDHFIVVPKDFTTPRDGSKTRVHHEYRITLTAVDEATESGLRRNNDNLDDETNPFQAIVEVFNDARAAIAEVVANLDQIRRYVGNVQAVMNNAIQLVNAVGNFINASNDSINYPLQLAASVAESVGTASDTLANTIAGAPFGILNENERSLRRLEVAIDRISQFDDKFEAAAQRIEDLFEGERALTADDVVARAAGATVGSIPRLQNGSARIAGLNIPRGTALIGVPVERTDTIESIADEANTTPEAIIVINDLRPPYITAYGGPGILKPGDIILVPAASGGEAATGRGANDFLTAEEALYGIDIALDKETLKRSGKFELLVNETNNSTDFGFARGVANVVQGVEIIIGTEIGTTVFLRRLGIRRNIGVKGTTQHVLLASVTLREAMLQDTRISGFESSRVVLDSLTGELTQEITPIVSGQRPGAVFALPFGSATGGGG